MKTIKKEDLKKEISQILTEYGNEVDDVLLDVMEDVGKEGRDMVKNLSPVGNRRAGKYKNTWTFTVQRGRLWVRVYIHQKATKRFNNWRLVHLLENGHMARDGSWVPPVRPHVKPTQDYVDKKAMEELKRRIERL